MNVIVIPEDPTYDQHILQPLCTALLDWIEVPAPRVRIAEGNVGGVPNALDVAVIGPIVERYAYIADLILLCVDRDAKDGRRDELDHVESQIQTTLDEENAANNVFFAIAAVEDVETWALAGLDLPEGISWTNVRSGRRSAKDVLQTIAKERRVYQRQSRGYKSLGREAASNYKTVRQRCDELHTLETRIKQWVRTR